MVAFKHTIQHSPNLQIFAKMKTILRAVFSRKLMARGAL